MIKLNSREIKKINSIIGTSYDDETLFSEIYSGNRSKIYKKENYCFKFCLISDDYNNEKETYIKLGENEYLAKIYGFDDESRLLVMEYIEGISIEDYFIRERNIPLNIVNRVFEIRLDMLKKYCYDFDIKGRDIFIQNNGNLIFLDFGVVSILDKNDNIKQMVQIFEKDLKNSWDNINLGKVSEFDIYRKLFGC